MFKDLYGEEKHSDVTLVCDDQAQFKAHKIFLRACSPVFKKIIDNNPSQHPLIYLRGIQRYEVESILQFFYFGEATLYQVRVGEFIKVAKDLEVKEISEGVDIQNEEEAKVSEIKTSTEELCGDNNTNSLVEELEMEKKKPGKKNTKISKLKKEKKKPNPKKIKTSKENKSTECLECAKVFSSKGSLQKHRSSYH